MSSSSRREKIETMPSSRNVIKQSAAWVDAIEDSLNQGIAEFLQSCNPEITTPQAFSFLCAPWVHFFTHGVLHRYEQITKIEGNASHFHLLVTAPPGDTLSFIELSRTSTYQHMIDAALRGESATFSCRSEIEALEYPKEWRTAKIIGYKTAFPKQTRYSVPWLSLGSIRFCLTSKKLIQCDLNLDLRNELCNHLERHLLTPNPALTAWLSSACAALFPIALLENLGPSWRHKLGLPVRQALYSTNAWDIMDEWKIYALAQKQLHHARWIGSPHALNHGCLAVFWQREFELKYLDHYLSWGWQPLQRTQALVHEFHPPHFPFKLRTPSPNWKSNGGLLISSAGRPRHLLEYPYDPEQFEAYLHTQTELAMSLQTLTGQAVMIRTRPKDLGWDLKKIIHDLGNENVSLEFQKGSFSKRVQQSAVHISDNFSTTIAESLLQNHPTLVLITDDYFQLHPQAQSAWDVLEQVGIAHTNPRSLLHQVEKIKSDIMGWWSAPHMQQAIKKFLHHQVRPGATSWQWTQTLLNIAKSP